MKAVLCLFGLLLLTSLGHAQARKSSLPVEPGTIPLEDILTKPVRLVVKQEASIFYQATLDRTLGTMAAGTQVTLVGMSDTAYRVRGRARHGDVAGWMRATDVVLPDPKMPDKLKALYERQLQVTQLIDSHQVALGMTRAEVQESLGKPTRTTSRLTAAGREDKLEYAVFEKVAQPAVGRTATGQLVESVIYVKVEVGTLSISFKDNVVDVIEETKGNPLRGAAVKIVPTPIFLW